MREIDKDKEWYTTRELSEAQWFPIKSPSTIRQHIEKGNIKAKNISPLEEKKQWRISKKSVNKFLSSD